MPIEPQQHYCEAILQEAHGLNWKLGIGTYAFCWLLPTGEKHQELHYCNNGVDALHTACVFFEKLQNQPKEISYE
jgi:hypothetical protein